MRIRTILAAAIAAVAVTAAPASAETALSAYINGRVDLANVDSGFGDDEFTNYGVGGAVAFAVANNIGAQLDLDIASLDDDLSEDEVLSGTAHVFHRTASGLIGGFLGAAEFDGESAWGGGVEGEVYQDNFTFGGALTYATADDIDLDLWAINGHVRYFLSDNFVTQVDAGFGNLDGPGGDGDAWTVGAGLGYQLASVPVNFGARVGYLSADDINLDVTTISLSVGYTFTGESLKTRDRTGASQGGFLSSFAAAIL